MPEFPLLLHREGNGQGTEVFSFFPLSHQSHPFTHQTITFSQVGLSSEPLPSLPFLIEVVFALSSPPSYLKFSQMTTVAAPGIAFLTVPNLLTCSEVTIQWTYNATTPPTYDYPLVVTNIGVDQSGLNRKEYPLVSRQSTTLVNMTLAAVNASTGKFDWSKVDIPQGWYRMNIYATAGAIPSNIFNVTNGLDVSCVVTPSQSSTSSSSTSPTTPASTDFPPSTIGPSVTTTPLIVGNSSVKRGAIAGGVVGGAVLFLIAAFALWLFRRRKTRTRNTSRTSVSRTKGNHNLSDSTGAILPLGGKGNRGNSRQLSTSEEDFTSEKSAVADDHALPNLPPNVATRPHSRSSTPGRRHASMFVTSSFESCDSVRPRPSTSPSHPRHSHHRTRRTSRKPVPAYDPSEFPTAELNDIPSPGSPDSVSGGAKMFYLIPDPPLSSARL